jgi:hypothetical protein
MCTHLLLQVDELRVTVSNLSKQLELVEPASEVLQLLEVLLEVSHTEPHTQSHTVLYSTNFYIALCLTS